jgi:hypothetical protein
MKKPVLVLLALFVLIPLAQAMAQTPPAAPAPVVDAATAQFLATLAGGQIQVSTNPTPAPLLETGCSTDADCPTGQICCFLCGNPPDDGSSCKACTTPFRGRCPIVD